MKKIFYYVSVLILCFTADVSYSQTLRSVNFQGAGWVTAVKYTTNGSRLYARTDVGGVFRSDNGGVNWSYISSYAVTLSGLFVQGLVLHPVDNNTIYIACGSSYRGTDPGMGVWKTTDGGNSWTHVLQNVNFSGNDDIRWGGECIALDPVNPEIVYAGGRESGIYKSLNGGATWSQIAASNIISGNISTITIRPGTSGNTAEIWAGSEDYNTSTAGVWRSLNGGTSWTQLRSSAEVANVVFRIAVKTDGTAFVAYNESLQKYTPAGGIWTDIPGFLGAGNLAAVHFMGNENKIIASRMNYTKLSNDGGLNFDQVLPMTIQGPLPKHSYNWAVVDWARNQFQQNPVNANEWYMSGGFGCFKSSDAGQNWRYATDGINIPVMYRTHFHLTNPNYVYLPMGDLTMGRITDGGASGEITDYAFYSFAVLQDFSNATAVLTTSANPNKQYIVGGNIYAGEISGIFVTTNNGANYSKVIVNGLPTSTGRPIVNGIVSDANENQLIVYIGGDWSNIGATGGIYWSINGGQNFTRANGLSPNIIAPNTFYEYYGLAKDPFNTSKRYGYFEGDGGGFYESGDEGKNWTLKNNIIAGYKPSGGLCVHPSVQNLFYAALAYNGLYKTTDGGTTWNNIAGWESAEQVDSRNNVITAFGIRTGDTYNKIYKSLNNGNSWAVINTGQFKLPNTTSLVINPHNTNQLWIGTTGNGTFIYDGLNIGIQNISSEIPSGFSLYQNYPNPFNPSTIIRFQIPSVGSRSQMHSGVLALNTTLKIYDILGKEIATLVNEKLQAGTYETQFSINSITNNQILSGIYFYKLTSGNFSQTKKMILLK